MSYTTGWKRYHGSRYGKTIGGANYWVIPARNNKGEHVGWWIRRDDIQGQCYLGECQYLMTAQRAAHQDAEKRNATHG